MAGDPLTCGPSTARRSSCRRMRQRRKLGRKLPGPSAPYRPRGTRSIGRGTGMTATFDPLATSELIIDGYRRYLKSLLPVRDARIAAALDQEISRSALTKGPLL